MRYMTKSCFLQNIYTKKSTWERPDEPVYPPEGSEDAPPGPPPGYSGGNSNPTDTKSNPYETHNDPNIESDAALAARLQAEEDERAASASGSRNAMQDYQNTPMPSQSPGYQQELPPREQKRGLFSKLMGKTGSSGSGGYGRPQQGGYPQQQGYQPQYGQPAYGQPAYGQPAYGQPAYGQPPYGQVSVSHMNSLILHHEL